MGPFVAWINPISHSAYYQAVYCSQQAACKHYNLTFFCGLFVRAERNCLSIGWISVIHKNITNSCRDCKLFCKKTNKKVNVSAAKHTQKTHKYEFSWMKYGFNTAKRRVRQAKQTVSCIEATSGCSWASPEGVLYSLVSDGLHRKPHTVCEDLILPGAKDIVVEILGDETAGEVDTIQLSTKQWPSTGFVISTFVGAHTEHRFCIPSE